MSDPVDYIDRHYTTQMGNPDYSFTTHIPVLVGLSSLFPIKAVLELGMGIHSTPLFLDRDTFPHLEILRCYEDDQNWAGKIPEDDRLQVFLVNDPIYNKISHELCSKYDLIFIDNSHDSIGRSATIRSIAALRDPRNIIVVHDFEVLAYQDASRSIPNCYTAKALLPWTGILWDRFPMDVGQLERMDDYNQRFHP